MNQNSRKKLGNKVMLYCILFAFVLTVCIGFVGYRTYKVNIQERYQIYAKTLLRLAAAELNGDDISECIKNQEESDGYHKARETLNTIKEHSEISYIYALYFPDMADFNKVCFVMNGLTKEERQKERVWELSSSLGEDGTDSFKADMRETFWKAAYGSSEEGEGYIVNNTDEYGYQMTGYTLIRDSLQNPVCIVAIDISMNKINQDMRSYLLVVMVAGIFLLSLFLMIFIRVLNKTVILPVRRIADSAREFMEQTSHTENPAQLEYHFVEIHTEDEIQILSESLHSMTDELKNYMDNLRQVTAEKERIGAEIHVATQIQASMLPSIFPAFPARKEFDIYATMQPAREVGGDFYDFFLVDEDRLAMVMADVSGKGVPAALFMVIAKTLIKNHVQLGESPAAAFTMVNQMLCESNDTGMFVTAWLGILTLSTGELAYTNAGHNPPLVRRKGGDFEYLMLQSGFVLAGMENIKYRQSNLVLGSGDMLCLYTDGVTEAMDADNAMYGEKRLQTFLNGNKDRILSEILWGVKADIDDFVKGAPQFDDITMLVLRIN